MVEKHMKPILTINDMEDAIKDNGIDIEIIEEDKKTIAKLLAGAAAAGVTLGSVFNNPGKVNETIPASDPTNITQQSENTKEDTKEANKKPEEKEEPKPSNKALTTDDLVEYAKSIMKFEGKENLAYDDINNTSVKAIGYGHTMGNGNDKFTERSKNVFKKAFGNDNNWELVRTKKQKLTDNEVNALLGVDLIDKVKDAKRIIPTFDELPLYLRVAIVNGFFRGDLSGSPKTIALINEKKYAEAAKEFLNNNEYRKAAAGKAGIRTRMEYIANSLIKMQEEIAGLKINKEKIKESIDYNVIIEALHKRVYDRVMDNIRPEIDDKTDKRGKNLVGRKSNTDPTQTLRGKKALEKHNKKMKRKYSKKEIVENNDLESKLQMINGCDNLWELSGSNDSIVKEYVNNLLNNPIEVDTISFTVDNDEYIKYAIEKVVEKFDKVKFYDGYRFWVTFEVDGSIGNLSLWSSINNDDVGEAIVSNNYVASLPIGQI